MSFATFTFSTTSAERKAFAEKRISFSPVVPLGVILTIFGTSALQITNLILTELLPRVTLRIITLLSVTVALIFVAFLWTIISSRIGWPSFAASGTLTLSDTGLVGTLDGAPLSLRWRDIRGAQDIDDAIVVLPYRSNRVIPIPKKALTDPVAVWYYLDDHLVSKRNLIRSAATSKRIINPELDG